MRFSCEREGNRVKTLLGETIPHAPIRGQRTDRTAWLFLGLRRTEESGVLVRMKPGQGKQYALYHTCLEVP